MPFRSARQRRYMHAKHPEIAARWEREAKAAHQSPVQPKRGPRRTQPRRRRRFR